MFIPRQTLAVFFASLAIVAVGCNRAPERLTPEAASAKGDALLREMSKNLSAIQTFSFTSDEVSTGGPRGERRLTRRITIRRPNAFTFTVTGDERDGVGWYDGKQLTIVGNRAKVWARGPMPPTLDEALDFVSAEYAVQMPGADLLYSSPYDALMTADTKGGWVDVQKIGDQMCDHLAYTQPNVDWEIWLGQARRLPCQAKIIYKNEPGQPSTTVTFRDGDMSPQVSTETFTAKIPDGYQRIKIMRHATVEDTTVEGAPSAPSDEVGTTGKPR